MKPDALKLHNSIMQWPVVAATGLVAAAFVLIITALPKAGAGLALVLFASVIIVSVTGNPKRFAFMVLVISIPLGLDIRVAGDTGDYVGMIGLDISLGAISLAILYILWLSEAATTKGTNVRWFPKITVPALGLVGVAVMSLVSALDTSFAVYGVIRYIYLFLLFFYVANHVSNNRDLESVVRWLLYGLAIQVVVVLVQFFLGRPFSTVDVLSLSEELFIGPAGSRLLRPPGLLGHPTDLASYLAPMLILCLCVFAGRYRVLNRNLLGVLLAAGIGALLATLTRAGWVSFALASLIVIVLGSRYGWFKPRHSVLLILAFLVTISLLSGPIENRISRTSISEAVDVRISLMDRAFQFIRSQPVFGIGVNNYGVALRPYQSLSAHAEWTYTVHNSYLIVATEMGVVGAGFFLWFLLAAFTQSYRGLRPRDPAIIPIATALVAGLVGYGFNMMVEGMMSTTLLELLWLMVGLAAAIGHISRHLPDVGTKLRVELELTATGS